MKTFRNRKQLNDCGCDSCADLTLLTPADGNDGERGGFGGNSAPYKFSTTTTSTPSSGYIQFDNANLGAATLMYVNKLDRNSADLALWLTQIFASGDNPSANLRLFSETDYSLFADFLVTGGSQSVDVLNISITPIVASSGSPFSNNMKVILTYSNVGQTGSSGTDGTDGTTILHNSLTTVSSGDTSSSWVTQKTYTISSASMPASGDQIVVTTEGYNSDSSYATDGKSMQFGIQILNNAVSTFQSMTFTSYTETIQIKVEINRKSNSELRMAFAFLTNSANPLPFVVDATGLDLSLDTDINVKANTDVAGVDTLRLTVEKNLI